MDGDEVGRDATRLDLHHVPPNHARSTSPAHQSVDRHARFAPLERTHARPKTCLVRHRRTGQPPAVTADSYRYYRESQIVEPRYFGLPGAQPNGGPLR